jgi:hypothetical protein
MQSQELIEMMRKDGYSDEVIEAAAALFEKVEGHPNRIGDVVVAGEYWMETHTLGCRRAANEPDDTVHNAHWAIGDEFKGKEKEGDRVYGDPEDGIFLTVSPQLTAAPEVQTKNASRALPSAPNKRKPKR